MTKAELEWLQEHVLIVHAREPKTFGRIADAMQDVLVAAASVPELRPQLEALQAAVHDAWDPV